MSSVEAAMARCTSQRFQHESIVIRITVPGVVGDVCLVPCIQTWLEAYWHMTRGEFVHQLPAQTERVDDVVVLAMGKRQQFCAQIG